MKSAVSVIRYPNGIDWNGKEVKFVVGWWPASTTNTCRSCPRSPRSSPTRRRWRSFEAATTVDEVLALFGKINC